MTNVLLVVIGLMYLVVGIARVIGSSNLDKESAELIIFGLGFATAGLLANKPSKLPRKTR